MIDDTQFVIGDERGNVYRIRRDGRNLAKDAEAVLEGRLVTPLANSGQRVFVGAMQGNNAMLIHFLASDLDSSEAVPLTASINFGPVSLQEIVLVGTADGVLHAFGAQGQELWTMPVDSAVVGVGVSESASELFVATTAGSVLVVGAADGKVQTTLNAGEPLDGAPFIEAGRLFAPAFDGSIRVLAKP